MAQSASDLMLYRTPTKVWRCGEAYFEELNRQYEKQFVQLLEEAPGIQERRQLYESW
jgi:hypothetical protein